MVDEEIKRIEYYKGQGDLIKLILPILAQLIIPYLKLNGTITLDTALLFDIPFIIILVWMLVTSTSKKSTIDWDHFHTVMLKVKSRLDWGNSLIKDAESRKKGKDSHKLGGHLADISYNNYILSLYLIALYESDKEKFAKELWDKARISEESYKDEQIE